jgi:hypothetical protein
MSSTIWNPYTKSYYLDCGRDGLIHVVSDCIVVKLLWRYENRDLYLLPAKVPRYINPPPLSLALSFTLE